MTTDDADIAKALQHVAELEELGRRLELRYGPQGHDLDDAAANFRHSVKRLQDILEQIEETALANGLVIVRASA